MTTREHARPAAAPATRALTGRVWLATLFLFAMTPAALAFEVAGRPAADIDRAPGVKVIDLPITQSGVISDLRVGIATTANFSDDLTLFLIHPDGSTAALLYEGAGHTAGAMLDVTFDDAAAAPAATSGSVLGQFQPLGPLSVFDGLELSGTWQLRITDPVSPFDGTELIAAALRGETTINAMGPSANDVDVVSPGVTVPLVVSGEPGSVDDLDFSFHLSQPCPDDVALTLSKDGLTSLVKSGMDVCGIDDPAIVVTLDDEAAAPYPFGGDGTFQPVPGTLSVFDGAAIDGTWNLTLSDDLGFDGEGTDLVSWSLQITRDFDETFPGPPESIDGGTHVLLDVMQSGTIADLDVAIHLTMTCPNDVQVSLSHLGMTAVLKPAIDPDCLSESAVMARFDDEAVDPFPPSGVGTFQPGTPLSVFDGMPLEGVWELRLEDDELPDEGTDLASWSLLGTLASDLAGPGQLNADAGDVVVPLMVTQEGDITDLDVSINLSAVCPDDLQVFLTHLGVTTQFKPANDPNCDFGNAVDARFDDESTNPYVPSGVGTFQPSPGTLAVFDGMPLAGEWELRLVDEELPGEGTELVSWTLHATHNGRAEASAPGEQNIDVESPGIDIPFMMPLSGTIEDLDFFIEIQQDYADDVDIFLSHGAVTVHVYDAIGDNEDSVIDAHFDDEAGASYPANGSAIGRFTPSPDLLAAFDGMELGGAWTLTLVDEIEPGDDTPLVSWTLAAALVPEPSVALQGLSALGALIALRMRRRHRPQRV